MAARGMAEKHTDLFERREGEEENHEGWFLSSISRASNAAKQRCNYCYIEKLQ